MKKIFALIVVLMFLSLPIVLAEVEKKDKDALLDAIAKGGNRLLSTQGPNSGSIPYNWEWIAGDGYYGNPNLQGITATGLLAAFEKTGNSVYLEGAKKAGNTLKARYAAAPNDRPYAQDVEFLVRLAKDSKDKSYLEVAKKWYANVIRDFTAEANVARYITRRGGSLAGWDLASQIRAADATGNKEYAKTMAKELIRRSADWVHVPSYGFDYTTISYGSLLWALHGIGNNHATIEKYREFLLANQNADGSWEGGDFQTTAYVILGLDAVKGEGKELKNALALAGNFLVSTQTNLGGWFYTGDGEYPEVDSEAVMSLGSFDGLHKIKSDKHVDYEKPKKGGDREKPFEDDDKESKNRD